MKFSSLLVTLFFAQAITAQVIEKPKEIEPTQIKVTEEILETPPVQVQEGAFGASGEEVLISEVEIASDPRAAQFPGGQDSLMFYITDAVETFIFQDTNETFPWGEQVFVVFEVGTKGEIINPLVELGYNALLDSAALRIIREMPNWIPATNELGEPVVSTNRLTLTFDLFDEEMLDYEEMEEPGFKSHYASFEFGMQMNTNTAFGFDPNFSNSPEWQNVVPKSLVFNVNLFSTKFKIIENYLGLTTGYGFSFVSSEFKEAYTLVHTDGFTNAILDTAQHFNRNTLSVSYFTIPLLLEVTNKGSFKDAFYLNIGVIGGVRMYSQQRQTGVNANGDNYELTTKSKFNLNPWMLDATVRMGYGPFGVFATYAMLSTFKSGATVNQFPLRFGVSLNIPQ
ncbi:MAG: hypothetical protein RLZZ65_580 [Bacteroidota bacterium]|jgi:hypothetical protein